MVVVYTLEKRIVFLVVVVSLVVVVVVVVVVGFVVVVVVVVVVVTAAGKTKKFSSQKIQLVSSYLVVNFSPFQRKFSACYSTCKTFLHYYYFDTTEKGVEPSVKRKSKLDPILDSTETAPKLLNRFSF